MNPIQPRAHWLDRMFSPHMLLRRAVMLSLVFLLCEVAGLRVYTCILCGTSPDGQPVGVLAVFLTGFYLFFYFAFICAVPVLLLASLILLTTKRLSKISKTSTETDHEKQDINSVR